MIHLVTHRPANRFCPICQQAKIKKAQARRIAVEGRHEEKHFGDLVHIDHSTIADAKAVGLEGECCALQLVDHATRLKGLFPSSTKGANSVKRSVKFFGGRTKIKAIRSDNAREYKKAADDLGALHFTSTPYHSANNTTAETAIQQSLHDIRSVLLQSGLNHCFWPNAANYVSHAENVHVIADKTPGSRPPFFIRFPGADAGPTYPFGALVHFRPPPPFKGKRYDPATKQGLYLGCFLQPGMSYHGDCLVLDLEDLSKGLKPHMHRVRAPEIRFPPLDQLSFPAFEARKLRITAELRTVLDSKVDLRPIMTDELEDQGELIATQPQANAKAPDEEIQVEESSEVLDSGSVACGFDLSQTVERSEGAGENPKTQDPPEQRVPMHAPMPDGRGTSSSSSSQPKENLKGPIGRPATHRPPHWKADEWGRLSRKQREHETRTYRSLTDLERTAVESESTDVPPAASCLTHESQICIPGNVAIEEVLCPSDSELFDRIAKADRVLVEFCCEPDSMIGKRADAAFPNTLVIRASLAFGDILNPSVLDRLEALVEACSDYKVDIHGSVPCTPWANWQKLNLYRLGPIFRAKLMAERDQTLIFIEHYKRLALKVKAKFGRSSWEWPDGIEGWNLDQMIELEALLGWDSVKFYGCTVGLVSKFGIPIRKPWKIKTDCPHLIQAFSNLVCNHPTHQPAEGQHTKATGFYPVQMSDMILESFRLCAEQVLFERDRKTRKQVQCILESAEDTDIIGDNFSDISEDDGHPFSNPREFVNKDVLAVLTKTLGKMAGKPNKGKWKRAAKFAAKSILAGMVVPEESTPQNTDEVHSHREKEGEAPLIPPLFAMVHKLLSKADPEYHTDDAKAAIREELLKLVRKGVWDTTPLLWSEVSAKAKRDGIQVHIGRVFHILSIKNAESLLDATFKARFVYQGSDIRDQEGIAAFFTEIDSNPAQLSSIRLACAYAASIGVVPTCADASQAYVQADMVGAPTYCRLPRELAQILIGENNKLPDGDICFRMRKALYGHPASGRIWEDHLGGILTRLGYQKVSSFRGLFMKKHPGIAPTLLATYVDDFVMCGKDMASEWAEISKQIDFGNTPPAELTKCLGVKYSFAQTGSVIKATLSMKDFAKSCCERYREHCGIPKDVKIRNAETPMMPLTVDSSEGEGKFKKQAPSLLMKPLYMCRAMYPILAFAIARLARYVTKWKKSHDDAIHRLYQFLERNCDLVLECSLDSERQKDIWIQLYVDADLGGCPDTVKSTSGFFLRLTDGTNFWPLDWGSKLQTFVSTSTCESEVVSMTTSLKASALPVQELISELFGREVRLEVCEDNTSTIAAVKKGYSNKLAHLPRTHKLSVAWTHDVISNPSVDLNHCRSEDQLADVFTKPLDREKLGIATAGLGMVRDKI